MAKGRNANPVDSPSKRERLPVAKNPVWVTAGSTRGGLALGYRRRAGKAGAWVARLIHEGRRAEKNLGEADDDFPGMAPASPGALPYRAAIAAAAAWAERQHAAWAGGASGAAHAPTVKDAVDAYIAQRKRRPGEGGRDAELRLGRHVLAAPLAAVTLAELHAAAIRDWRAGLRRGGRGSVAAEPAVAPKGGKASKAPPPLTPSTVNRLLNDLRAALNLAGRTHRRILSPGFAQLLEDELRGEAEADEPRGPQLLGDADTRRLVDAAFGVDDDFGALVLVLAATGTRFGQAIRITVADVQPGLGRIMVPVARKGRSDRKTTASRKPAHIAVPIGEDVLARLQPLLSSRRGHEPLLTRWHHRQIRGDKATGTLPRWERAERRPWTDAAEMTRPWREAIAAAGLPADLVPYALRHSSIVRGLKARLPLRLVAALHDTSAAMIERTYSAFIVDAAEDLARAAVVALAPAPVAQLRKLQGA